MRSDSTLEPMASISSTCLPAGVRTQWTTKSKQEATVGRTKLREMFSPAIRGNVQIGLFSEAVQTCSRNWPASVTYAPEKAVSGA